MAKDKPRILIVDDEEDICEILQFNLESEGFETDVALSAEDAMTKKLKKYNLILLDVMMGKMSGFRLAEKIRKDMSLTVPIIFLTAKDTENDVVTGFNIGADDYIPKPFSIKEVVVRVKAVMRRSSGEIQHVEPVITSGKFKLDTEIKRLLIGDKKIELTRKEFEVMRLLMENEGRIFPREDILSRVWSDDVVVTDRTVDVNITRLRKKLGEYGKCIRNKSGFGYYFEV
ncbi:response regulator transcription factor [Prolixibacter denitrificans]|uniref:DNA-binding response OmpR family regulator n=1 Tax=Prolixibacter denitrificans TaxID=1541063 RepID=A0A2P8CGB8_9BACT|nr:response regulator transcription factor [Prolixibacter denitrificans]PSK84014.1 DNA-binding response OmpR family regulator [Prolixibacter denitrificans]GET23556.1 DNA-binding response regulator [Prolixibacter denitrificans]